MTQVNIHEAKTQLSKLIEKCEAGEEIIIANRNKPVARLEPINKPKPVKRQLGILARSETFGKGDLPFEAFTTDGETLRAFEGSEIYPTGKS